MEEENLIGPWPIETNGHYMAFVEYLEKKESPKAKRLLEKLKSMKDTDEYFYFKEYLLWEIFIEAF